MTEYYTTPNQEVFDEVKKEVLKIFKNIAWEDSPYYREKKKEIDPINNIKDNMMTIIAKLSWNNLEKLSKRLSNKTKKEIYDRLVSVNAYETKYFKY